MCFLQCARLSFAVAALFLIWMGFSKTFLPWSLLQFLYLYTKSTLNLQLYVQPCITDFQCSVAKEINVIQKLTEAFIFFVTIMSWFSDPILFWLKLYASQALNWLTCFSSSCFHHLVIKFCKGRLNLITDFCIETRKIWSLTFIVALDFNYDVM